MQNILAEEFGGMAESLYSLSATVKDDRWARVGDRSIKKRFVNMLGLWGDALRGLRVNTHVPRVIAPARPYEISGDVRFHDVPDRGEAEGRDRGSKPGEGGRGRRGV